MYENVVHWWVTLIAEGKGMVEAKSKTVIGLAPHRFGQL
jgi:hypothetical protein